MRSSPNRKGDEKFNQSQMQEKMLINIHISRSQTPCSSVWQDCVLNDVIKSDIHKKTMCSIPPLHYILHILPIPLKRIQKFSFLQEDFIKGRNKFIWSQINSVLYADCNDVTIISVFKIKQNTLKNLSEA